MIPLKNILLVGAGGMLGSMLRYIFFLLVGVHTFPYSTLLVNIAGSLIIGVVFGLLLHTTSSFDWRLLIATGFCGGFTTFSAFSIECVTMLQQQKYTLAATYIVASVAFGIAAAFIGFAITNNLYRS